MDNKNKKRGNLSHPLEYINEIWEHKAQGSTVCHFKGVLGSVFIVHEILLMVHL